MTATQSSAWLGLVARVKKPDRAKAEAAVGAFLDALGFDPKDPTLSETPRRVARVWIETLTEGYEKTPASALGRLQKTEARAAVIARPLPFIAVCPHHLLPMIGQGAIAFVPNGRLPGFGRIPKLLDALSRRLVLQEELTQDLADALQTALSAEAVACLLEAQHSCVAVTDPARQGAFFSTFASAGDPIRSASLLKTLLGRPISDRSSRK